MMANLEIVYHLIGECNEHMEIVEATREHLRNKPNYGYIDYYQSFDDALEAGKKLIADKKAELMSELAMLDPKSAGRYSVGGNAVEFSDNPMLDSSV